MKRSRDDDVFESSQGKRPVISSRAEPSGLAQMSTASSAQRLTTHDALSYLKRVKEMFKDKKDKYDEFLEVMKNFKAQRIDTSGVISRVKELFEGHRNLILGFNAFLPKGFEITFEEDEPPYLKKKPVDFEEAISFVNKIKTRFDGDDHVYRAFLDILNMYRKDSKSITDVYKEVEVLFQDHADLLVEFTHFLPDASGAASVHLSQPTRNHTLGGDDRGSPMTTTRPFHVEKKPAVSYALRDQNANHPDTEQWNRVEKEKGKKEDRDNNEWEHDDISGHKRKSVRRDDSLTDQFYQGMQELVSGICEKVKERLKDTESHKKFSDCVRSYESKFVTTPQFRMLVESVLGTHPDLIKECEDLITYVEKTGCLRNNKQFYRSLKTEDRDGDDHDVQDRDKNRDRERERYGRGLPFSTKDVPGQKMPLYASKEKFMAKPIQELDLSNCESCTPSYRLLPANYPIPSASRRTDIGKKVLNDNWVSVTSGSEDYSFKHMRKNQYEESLFRCEDDRFELDMLLESVNVTSKRVEELLDTMNAHSDKIDSSFRIEDNLTALNLRCIERLYGDHGLDVMDVLKKNAPLALPVILTRLKQKQEEWARCRADFNKVWAEIYAKNYHKSLDHRSFYFKQQDTKNLSAKALLAEIKELSEKNQNEDEIILSISAGYRQPVKPDLQFEYPDPDIQEDLNRLMQFSCGEVCTPEQRDKVMKIWTTFLETMLGVPSRSSSAKYVEVVEANDSITKTVADIGEINNNPAGEAAPENDKPSSMSQGETEIILTEQCFSSRVRMANGNGRVDLVTSPNVDFAGHKSEVLCIASQTGVEETDANMTSAMAGASKLAGCFEKGTASAAGEMDIGKKNASDQQEGAEGGNADSQIVAMPAEESQDGCKINPTTSSMGMVPEEVKARGSHEETEAHTKSIQEGDESSHNRIIEQTNSAAFGDSVSEAAQQSCENAVSTRRSGGQERCTVEAEREPGSIANDEGEESAQGSLDSENASENGDVSASESADGEECSPEEPDEDGDPDEKNNKADSEGEAEGPADVHESEGVMPCSDHLQGMKPLLMKIPEALRGKENSSEIFYGNDSFYLLFRLHQMLYERMQSAKLHSSSPENRWRVSNGANPTDSYARFKDALHSLLNGSSDNAKFEDDCRAIIGAQSYVLFTLDKLIHKLVKQLQTIATEEVDNRLLQLYAYERTRNPDTFSDAVYHENARFLLPEDSLYRIECFPSPTRLNIQLMNNEQDKPEGTAVSMDPNFASYLSDDLLSVFPGRKERPGVYLKSNKRRLLTGDEMSDTCKVMKGLIMYNGLEIKVAANGFKAAYVLDTEDFLYRPKSRRKILYWTFSSKGAPNGASNGISNGCSHRDKRRRFMFS